MLSYEGLVNDEVIKIEKIGEAPDLETLRFHDDNLDEKQCGLVEEKLQELFSSDALIQTYYDKDKKLGVIEMTLTLDKSKDDLSKLVTENKSLMEEYYKKLKV